MVFDDFPEADWDLSGAYCASKAGHAQLAELQGLVDKPVTLPVARKRRQEGDAVAQRGVHEGEAKGPKQIKQQAPVVGGATEGVKQKKRKQQRTDEVAEEGPKRRSGNQGAASGPGNASEVLHGRPAQGKRRPEADAPGLQAAKQGSWGGQAPEPQGVQGEELVDAKVAQQGAKARERQGKGLGGRPVASELKASGGSGAEEGGAGEDAGRSRKKQRVAAAGETTDDRLGQKGKSRQGQQQQGQQGQQGQKQQKQKQGQGQGSEGGEGQHAGPAAIGKKKKRRGSDQVRSGEGSEALQAGPAAGEGGVADDGQAGTSGQPHGGGRAPGVGGRRTGGGLSEEEKQRHEEEVKEKLRRKWEQRAAAKAAVGAAEAGGPGGPGATGEMRAAGGASGLDVDGGGVGKRAGSGAGAAAGRPAGGRGGSEPASSTGKRQKKLVMKAAAAAAAAAGEAAAAVGSLSQEAEEGTPPVDGTRTGKGKDDGSSDKQVAPSPAPPASVKAGPALGAGRGGPFAPGAKDRAPQATAAAAGSSVIDRMMARLQGGRFRSLNEQLYTQSGADALALMKESPELFQHYHEGFHQQTLGWPKQPVDVAIGWLATLPASAVVADFGCGDAKIMRSVKQKVHSFDLVASAPGVIACNMAEVPLGDAAVDAAVFSLALMGTDYGLFLGEASRVLKPKGWLWIAEVRSRFSSADGKENFKPFLSCLARLGFKLMKQDAGNKMFVTWLLRKEGAGGGGAVGNLKWPPLKACVYKRR